MVLLKKSIMVRNRNFFFIHKKEGGVLPCSPWPFGTFDLAIICKFYNLM